MPSDFTTADLASWHQSRQQLRRIAQREEPGARRRAGSGYAAAAGMQPVAGAPAHPGAAAAGVPAPGAAVAGAAPEAADPRELLAALEERADDFDQLIEDLRGADTAGEEDTADALSALADLLEEKVVPKLRDVLEKHEAALDKQDEEREAAEEEAEGDDDAA